MATSVQKNSSSAFVSANPKICIDLTKAREDEDEDDDGTHLPAPTSERSNEGGRSHINHRGLALRNGVVVADVSSIGDSSPRDNEHDSFEATDEDDDTPTLTGKYPRLTSCPPNRAPRSVKYNHKEAAAKIAKAQRKRIDRSRKAHGRFSPVPVNIENAASQQGGPAMWPKTSLAIRPKSRAGGNMKEKEGKTINSQTRTLCNRTKPCFEDARRN